MHRFFLLVNIVIFSSLFAFSQEEINKELADISVVKIHKQVSFPQTLSAGNYSGITHIEGSTYALVDDKSQTDGFLLVDIDFNPETGEIINVKEKDFISSGKANRDAEGIAYVPSKKTLFISGEKDNCIQEYELDGALTSRSLHSENIFELNGNYGLESLTYDSINHLFYTTSESTLSKDGQPASLTLSTRDTLRIQAFNDDCLEAGQWFYVTDIPTRTNKNATHIFGVSELCALGDGRLLCMEREVYTPNNNVAKVFGTLSNTKIYVVNPKNATYGTILKKKLLTTISTNALNFANFEGMCLGPTLKNNNQILILVSDSQGQYRGLLKDYFRTIELDYNR